MRVAPHALADELRRAVAAVADASGAQPLRFRPPYGIFTPAGLALVRRAGLEPLLWSKWGRDWRGRTNAEEIARLATRDLSTGDVILLHDADWYSAEGSHRRTAEAIPRILEQFDRQGLQIVQKG